GQMGRCLSPCLGDLDPNLYRRRLDAALRLFLHGNAGQRLLAGVEEQMRAAAADQNFERAIWLRRRLRRLGTILARLDGMLEATHARPRLALARHPTGPGVEAFWLAGGRLVDWGAVKDGVEELEGRTRCALAGAGPVGDLAAHVPPAEVDEVRIVVGYLASHPQTPQVVLDGVPERQVLSALLSGARETEAPPLAR
ncbi:MAG: UvrB/UvrC motif-containing protein, partial [Actinomycetota bacterium]|nr:UvrB/UvrC motif-containing protein [Actinomycetota bacterium]